MHERIRGSSRAALRAARLVVWGAAALTFASAPLAAQHDAREDEIEAPEVVRLRFRGVKAFDEGELEKSIETTASHCNSVLLTPLCAGFQWKAVYTREFLDRQALRDDVLRIKVFYFRRGYRDTQVDTTVRRVRDAGHVAVVFRVTEGVPTRLDSVQVVGAERELTARQRQRPMLLKRGSPLNLFQLDTSLLRLQQALWNQGYADGRVDSALVVDDSAHTARLRVTLTPRWLARIDSIDVTGNRKVAQQTIRNTLLISKGDVYKRDEVVRSQRALYESNLFRRAVIVPATGDSLKTVHIEVTEAPLHAARTSAGFNTFEFVQAEGRYTDYNFTGGARRLDLRAAVGNLFASGLQNTFLFRQFSGALSDPTLRNRSSYLLPTWQISADLTQPYFRGPRNTLAAGVFANRRAAPGVYVDRSQGAQGTFTRLLTERAPASLSYRFELSKVAASQVYFCINYGACDLATANLLSRQEKLSPLALVTTVDRSNNPLNPSSGFVASLGAEHASQATFSDYRYNRATAEGSVYRPFGQKVIAAHVRLGWVGAIGNSVVELGGQSGDAMTDILHPRKRFYAGGSQSVRGYGENQLGPRVLTVDPNELRGREVIDKRVTYRCLPTTSITQCPLARTAPAIDSATGVPLGDRTTTLSDDKFTPRPTGGTALLEANLEFRFPLVRVFGQQVGGAAFVDGASLGAGGLGSSVRGNSAVTPGLGVRYLSPVGAVRIDVGYQPRLSYGGANGEKLFGEQLCVISEQQALVPNPQGGSTLANTGQLVYLGGAGNTCVGAGKRQYDPLGDKGFLSRLVLHLSIGQAF